MSSNSRTDAIALLKRDHVTVKGLLKRLDASSGRATAQRKELFHQIENEIRIHSKIEEEIFYPAYKAAARKNDKDLYFEAREEHHLVDLVLAEMRGSPVASEEYAAKAKVLKDLVEHHAEEEETEMFPKARQILKDARLRELGMQMKDRKEELQKPILKRVASSIDKVWNPKKKAA
jgi:hypothetical protein